MAQTQPVVLLAEELSPATVEALGSDFEIRHTDGADRERLLADIADVDAILVRSATQVDAEAIAAAKNLKVIARAGVGLDNVDIKAATQDGVMVVNAPTSNIISAAELTVGHIISAARNIPAANASMKAGEWNRKAFTGVELFEKTAGIIGLGRIGALVAERLAGFGMKLVAYDPYVTPARAQQLGVTLVELDELLEKADFITIHMPKTPETTGMISADQFKLMKDTAFVFNVARGGLIDEDALYTALTEGQIAGAGIDVYTSEPAKDIKFIELPNVSVTPHLGASTAEAQEKAGVAVAKSVRLALTGELVPDAVNVAGGVIDENVRPGIPLAEKLGRIFSALAQGERLTSVELTVAGEIASKDVTSLKLAALKGVFTDVVSQGVSYVNAPVLAEQRGVATRLTTTEVSEDYRNKLVVSGALASGAALSVTGTLTGPKQIQKLTAVFGQNLEIPIEDHMLILRYEDRPGVVGTLGRVLGEHDVNIAGMQVAPADEQGQSAAVVTIDDALPEGLLETIGKEIGATVAREVDLEER